MSSSWRSRRATVSARVWNLAPGRFRHPVTAVDPFGRSGVADIQQELPRGFDMIDLKTIAAEATIAGALGLTALGMGLGVANAAPPSPVTSGTPWSQDKPHGDGHGHGDWHRRRGLGRGALARRARVTGGSTRASPPPVRMGTSPATCASSRGSCRRYSVAALGRWGVTFRCGPAGLRRAPAPWKRALAQLSDPETA